MQPARPTAPTKPGGGPKRTRPCNTRFHDSNCPGYSVRASGVDTVSFAFRPRGDRGLESLSEFVRPRREYVHAESGEVMRQAFAGGAVMVAKPVNGMRLGVFPGPGLVFAEGRLGAMLARSGDDHQLLPAADLATGSERAREALALIGFHFEPQPAAVRRLDLAAELRFDKRPDGLSFMRAMAALEVPGLMQDIYVKKGAVETVYHKTPKRGQVRSRVYRKDLESPGYGGGEVVVRLERQVRYPKAKQETAESIAGGDLEELYRGRLGALAKGSGSVVAAELTGAQAALFQRVEEGRVTKRQGERMLGTLAVLNNEGRDWYDESYTADRRVRELQALGIVLDSERKQRQPVPVGAMLTALVESFRAT